MSQFYRRSTYAIALVVAVVVGTYAPDLWLFGVGLLASVLGVTIVGISAGRLWHSDDYPTRCSFMAMLIGLTSFPASYAFST